MANRDLTKGEPGRILRAYCLPMFGSVFFQQMYNLADSFTAGRFIGEAALAAVGNSYELTLIYLAFALGCNTGASMVVARYFGAKRYDRVKTSIFCDYRAPTLIFDLAPHFCSFSTCSCW